MKRIGDDSCVRHSSGRLIHRNCRFWQLLEVLTHACLMNTQTSNRVLVLCSDLFFACNVTDAVSAAKAKFQTALTSRTFYEELATGKFDLAIVDLETSDLDLEQTSRIAAEQNTSLVAFGPHVRVSWLKEARDAGFHAVLTRGQIGTQLTGVVSELLAGDS